MATSASTRSTRVMSPYTTWLARIYVVVLVVWAIVYPQLDKVNSEFMGSVMNVIGAVLIVAGLYAFARTSPWVAVALGFPPAPRHRHPEGCLHPRRRPEKWYL